MTVLQMGHDTTTASIAQHAGMENLLRCWLRETDEVLPLDLASSGVRIDATITHRSAVGVHRFADIRISDRPADLASLAALLAREAAHRQGAAVDSGVDLVERVLDSARRLAIHLATDKPRAATAFLEAEQALTFGHPMHPTPKSRDSLTDAEARSYSPELGGSFPLHWFAVDPSLVGQDSALAESAERLIAPFTPEFAAHGVPEGWIVVPVHPWQARDLLTRPEVVELVDSGQLSDLGQSGLPWYPTSSLRTVYRPDSAVMLKLSLGLRITNSRRENLRKEMHRGVEVARLLDAGLADALAAEHDQFRIVRDPAWLAVAPGLDFIVRENNLGDGEVMCVAGFVESAIDSVIDPARWLRQYVRAVLAPIFWLYETQGIGLEAHQQNTLVSLDTKGYPVGGLYRDNQGYYFANSARDRLDAKLPGIGSESDTFVEDGVIDERLLYYIGVNNLLGLIGAFGSRGLADEDTLLRAARAELEHIRSRQASRLVDRLLSDRTLPCKANLFTRLREMDELVGPVATQSIYVTIDNPLVVR